MLQVPNGVTQLDPNSTDSPTDVTESDYEIGPEKITDATSQFVQVEKRATIVVNAETLEAICDALTGTKIEFFDSAESLLDDLYGA